MKIQKNKIKSLTSDQRLPDMIVIGLVVIAAMFALWTFTGQWPFKSQPYNSYILQAQSWLQGRLDLGKDYKWLELAIYKDKYYVSFPPLPSFIMLPFVALHWTACDGFIAVVSAICGAVYAYKLCDHFGVKHERAIMFALLVTVGSNWLFIAQNAWVWFIAQNLSFTFSMMALYYALKDKAGLSLAFWACAVGCRPLQFCYLPILLFLIYTGYAKDNAEASIADFIKKKWKCVILMAIIALVYMALNFARFGNPLEFGHNYLPEFQRVTTGQFHASYIPGNLQKIFKLPKMTLTDKWTYEKIDGFFFILSMPVFISYFVYSIRSILGAADKKSIILTVLIFVMMICEIVLTSAHKTMGGEQFGCRYLIDVLPMAFLGITAALRKKGRWEGLNIVLIFFGFAMNLMGSILIYVK